MLRTMREVANTRPADGVATNAGGLRDSIPGIVHRRAWGQGAPGRGDLDEFCELAEQRGLGLGPDHLLND